MSPAFAGSTTGYKLPSLRDLDRGIRKVPSRLRQKARASCPSPWPERPAPAIPISPAHNKPPPMARHFFLGSHDPVASMPLLKNMSNPKPIPFDRTGMLALTISAFMACVSSTAFCTACCAPIAPIAPIGPIGLIGNGTATALAWVGFVHGKRNHLVVSVLAILLMAVVHHCLFSNVLWVFHYRAECCPVYQLQPNKPGIR